MTFIKLHSLFENFLVSIGFLIVFLLTFFFIFLFYPIKWRMTPRAVYQLINDLDQIGRINIISRLDRKNAWAWQKAFKRERKFEKRLKEIFKAPPS